MKVLVSNVYRGNTQVHAYRARVRELRPAVVLAAEAEHLGSIPGFRRLGAPAWMPWQARMTAVYVRSGIEVHGYGILRLSEEVAGVRYADDRYAAYARIRHGGRDWCPVSVHLNPGRDRRSSAANADYVESLGALVRSARLDGYAPIVGGDWNRRADEQAKAGTPYDLARRMTPPGASVHLHGIDGLVLPPSLRVDRRLNPAVVMPGSDHKGLLFQVTAR